MAQLPSFARTRPTDVLAAPIGAFESETQAVIQRTSPGNEHIVLYAIATMLAVVLVLMSVVKLDRVVTSSGRILPSKGSIFVQPLDRAIVTGILVRTGDVVKPGEVLATLDPTFAQADLAQLQQKKASAEAQVARLRAEQAGLSYVADPASPYAVMQANIFNQRRAEYAQSIADFDARIRAASSVIDKGRQDLSDYNKRLSLARELEGQQQRLLDRGYGSRVRVIAATDSRVELERLVSNSENDAAQAQHDVSALSAQRAAYVGKWHDDIGSQLVTAQNDLDEATQSVVKASKVSDLSRLTSPAEAVVLKIGKASVGSVIDANAGNVDPLFTLVPLGGPLEAEVQVDARDIGHLQVGQTVRIKLDAYKFTTHGTATGVIKTISQGSFTDSEDGRPRSPYFKVRVVFTKVKLRNVPTDFRLIPGMTLQGDVIVGRRTIMQYLLEGAMRIGSEAMREA